MVLFFFLVKFSIVYRMRKCGIRKWDFRGDGGLLGSGLWKENRL